MPIDTALLKPRIVLDIHPDVDDLGYVVALECGHEVWSPGHPGEALLCGTCLHQLVVQVRELQERQRVP